MASHLLRALLIGPCLVAASCVTSTDNNESSPSPPGLGLAATRERASAKRVRGTNFAVAAQGRGTANAAHEIFTAGGNVVDAAVAASFAVSVERPQSTGLGGGGFLLLYRAKERDVVALDFRERAPALATERMYQDKDGKVIPGLSTEGILAGGVPGLVAGLAEIHGKYGKLPWAALLQPAIRLADEGITVYPELAEALRDEAEGLGRDPEARKIFYDSATGAVLAAGALLRQTDLARTLRAIAEHGRDGFYDGWVASALVKQQKDLDGLITGEDLEAYRPVYRQPVVGTYRGHTIASMPPPSSGGAHVVQILNMMEPTSFADLSFQSPEAVHRVASAMQIAFADRAVHLGDPDFVNVPVAMLTSKAYANRRMAEVAPDKARSSQLARAGVPGEEPSETTHFSLVDGDGNAVASTQTINTEFGAHLVVPGTGVVINNEMDDFSARAGVANYFGVIGGSHNAIAPGKRPLSSMAPTLVLRDGEVRFALGSPSGPRIISCVTLTIHNLIDYDMNLTEALAAPRFHHQWTPDEIRVDPPNFAPSALASLIAKGHKVSERELGCRVAIVARGSDGLLDAAADPRGEGAALTD